MKNIYEQETLAHKDDAIVKKYTKQIKLNKILWTLGSAVALAVTIVMIILSTVVFSGWEAKIKAIAIVIPAVVTVLAIVMTILIYVGNQIGVKTYKQDKITFYSGPWTNVLYINDKEIYKGSSEHKMVGTLSDESLCKIMLGTTKFSINILPPGSDPITGRPKEEAKPDAKVAQVKEEPKKEEK